MFCGCRKAASITALIQIVNVAIFIDISIRKAVFSMSNHTLSEKQFSLMLMGLAIYQHQPGCGMDKRRNTPHVRHFSVIVFWKPAESIAVLHHLIYV